MDYLKLLKVSQDLFYVLDELIADSEDQYPLENNAATNIQRVLRGKKVRKNVKIMTGASIEIERVFRGYLGRKASRNAARNKRDFMQYSILSITFCKFKKVSADIIVGNIKTIMLVERDIYRKLLGKEKKCDKDFEITIRLFNSAKKKRKQRNPKKSLNNLLRICTTC